jgi:hypothetical protein
MKSARTDAVAVYVPKFAGILILGGWEEEGKMVTSIEYYSPATDAFTMIPPERFSVANDIILYSVQLLDYDAHTTHRSREW